MYQGGQFSQYESLKGKSEKKVEDVKTGDELYSEEGNISKVLSITKKHTDGKRLISFKSEGFFFTEDHPFKTKKGWKTVNGHHAYLGTVDDLIDSNGNFIKDQAQDWGEFKLHMLKIQKLMVDEFGVTAKAKDQLADMSALASSMGSSDSAEND